MVTERVRRPAGHRRTNSKIAAVDGLSIRRA